MSAVGGDERDGGRDLLVRELGLLLRKNSVSDTAAEHVDWVHDRQTHRRAVGRVHLDQPCVTSDVRATQTVRGGEEVDLPLVTIAIKERDHAVEHAVGAVRTAAPRPVEQIGDDPNRATGALEVNVPRGWQRRVRRDVGSELRSPQRNGLTADQNETVLTCLKLCPMTVDGGVGGR